MKRKIILILKALGIFSPVTFFYRTYISLKRKIFRLFDKKSRAPRALVLVYHRIADLDSDPLLLAVSLKNFKEQMIMLKKYFEVISTDELITRINEKKLKGNEVVVTFDDGYKDNLTNALPIAQNLNVPFSIFITTSIFDSYIHPKNIPLFSWDTMYENKTETYLSEHDVKTLSKEPLVTIGAHTVSHPRLSDLPYEIQKKEIIESKKRLEQIINKTVKYFAYPFGDYSDIDNSASQAVMNSEYSAAFSNVQRLASEKSDIFRIPRILARDWSAEEMKRQINYFIQK